MQTDLPFFECPEDALRSAVQALGGAKLVGAKLWPDLSPDQAARKLLDSLNTARAERLQFSQVMCVLRWAHEAGYHGAALWMCGEIGYEARPIKREDEVERVAAIVEASTKTLAAAVATLERLNRVRPAA